MANSTISISVILFWILGCKPKLYKNTSHSIAFISCFLNLSHIPLTKKKTKNQNPNKNNKILSTHIKIHWVL